LIFVLLLVFAAGWVMDRHIRADAKNRASNFIAVHYLVHRAENDTLDPPPNDIRKVLNH
jgi:flagellar biogenesis protein FliO